MARWLLRLASLYLGLAIFGISLVVGLFAHEPEHAAYAVESPLIFAGVLVGATAGMVVCLLAAGLRVRFRVSEILLAMALIAAAFAVVSLAGRWLISSR
jgi:ABC-type uncharacterized transport system permease subunit